MMGLYSGGMGPLGWLAAGVFWFILLALVVWLVSRLLPASSSATTGPVDEPTQEALDDQLVAGEINLAAWQAHRSALAAPADGSTRRSRDVRCEPNPASRPVPMTEETGRQGGQA